MIIIWGRQNRESEVSTGRFRCPRCQSSKPYTLFRIDRYFTLFFVPVFPIGYVGEYLECQVCRRAYLLEEVQEAEVPQAAKQQLGAVRESLNSGASVSTVTQELMKSGIDEAIANKIVNSAAGQNKKLCWPCKQWYAESANRCSKCGKSLSGG